jgi:hypothetical protein
MVLFPLPGDPDPSRYPPAVDFRVLWLASHALMRAVVRQEQESAP